MRLLDIFVLQLLVGSSIALPSSPRENGKLEKRADSPFVGFDKCSLFQRNDIIRAWGDAQKLATIPAEFNVGGNGEAIFLPDAVLNIGPTCSGICNVGVLEERFWGKDIGQDYVAAAQIKNLNSHTPEIRISCEDKENPNIKPENRAKCSKKVNGLSIGGYAFGTSKERKDNTIVLCDLFFAPGQEFLSDIEKELRDSNQQKSGLPMAGKGKILLHELTHLPAIVEKDVSDTYAWYASEMYFNQIFGVPADGQNQPRDGDPDTEDDPPAQTEKWRNSDALRQRLGM
ncbi:oviduct-specific glyco protein [Rutstroemia sp. NJR-2017a BBW]|nr:oviduct-specific glyco protein [Rutstroemia sp. NJR-2017a BBW]